MRASRWRIGALCGAALVVGIWLTSNPVPRFMSGGHHLSADEISQHLRHAQQGTQQGGTPPPDTSAASNHVLGFDIVAYALLSLVLLGLLIFVVSAVRERRSRPGPVAPPTAAHVEGAIDAMHVPPDIVESADEQLAALRRGSPHDAILICWRALESACARSGLPPRPAETSTEFTARLLASWQVDVAATSSLAELAREARFSRHSLGEPEREQAVAALTRIRTDLRAHRSAEVPA